MDKFTEESQKHDGKTWKNMENMDKIIGNDANSGIPHSSESV